MKGENTWLAFLVIGIIILGVAIVYLYQATPKEFRKGVKVNAETFSAIISDADQVYIVMDVREVSNELTKRNILQCGVDFAGSAGLIGRNVTYVSLDNHGCTVASLEGLNQSRSTGDCIEMLNSDGVSLYIHEGTETEYYTRAAIIGVSDTYVLGTCSVNRKVR
ncbi:MAG: hypothetical protein QW590_02545 [Candidatus Bilamarchaeaceae archaeon]